MTGYGPAETPPLAWRFRIPGDRLEPGRPDRRDPAALCADAGHPLVGGRRAGACSPAVSPEKGAAEAIDIAQAAGIAIDVYGDAYDAHYAREQIDPRREAPGVTVHGGVARTSLWAAMARAAVVLCPARWDEPFGMAAAEAQACGTPVVAFQPRRAR